MGFAFKSNTNDTRESPAINICSNLLLDGAKLSIYDPKVKFHEICNNLKDLKNEVENSFNVEDRISMASSYIELANGCLLYTSDAADE